MMFCASAYIITSCQTKPVESATLPEPVVLPMEMTYKGQVALGDNNNVKTVMEFNKRLSGLNTDVGDLLADTVSFNFADGMQFLNLTRDSALVLIRDYIGGMNEVKVTFTKAIPIDNVDMKHEWVLSWTDEYYTYKDGKKEHTYLHETVRMQDGKIREAFQYSRKEPAASK